MTFKKLVCKVPAGKFNIFYITVNSVYNCVTVSLNVGITLVQLSTGQLSTGQLSIPSPTGGCSVQH